MGVFAVIPCTRRAVLHHHHIISLCIMVLCIIMYYYYIIAGWLLIKGNICTDPLGETIRASPSFYYYCSTSSCNTVLLCMVFLLSIIYYCIAWSLLIHWMRINSLSKTVWEPPSLINKQEWESRQHKNKLQKQQNKAGGRYSNSKLQL